MADATGYPLPKERGVVLQAPGSLNVERGAGAGWQSIARSGAELSRDAIGLLKQEQAAAQAAYLADAEVEARTFFRDARDRNAFNPEALDRETTGFIEGKMSGAEPWAINH